VPALSEVMYAETREQARVAITRFAAEHGAKYPKAVTALEQDADTLLTFFDFPAEHWKHLRTSNVIESPFATVRLRRRVTKGAGSRTKGLLMAYKSGYPLYGAYLPFSRGRDRGTPQRTAPAACTAHRRCTTWADPPPVCEMHVSDAPPPQCGAQIPCS
jgi:hypothetical protein